MLFLAPMSLEGVSGDFEPTMIRTNNEKHYGPACGIQKGFADDI